MGSEMCIRDSPPPGTLSTDGHGRTRSRERDRKRSNGHYARTSHGKWFKFGTRTPPDMFYPRTEFQLLSSIRSIGSPLAISPFPAFFAEGRGTHRPQSPRLPRSSLAVFFPGTVRANGAREELEILQADVSWHVLPLHQISWPSHHSFYRLPDPRFPSPGPSRSFSPRTAGASGLLRRGRRGLFPGHSLHGRYGQTEKRRRLKLGR